jgi:holo-[acyl-carrier protein] synthase
VSPVVGIGVDILEVARVARARTRFGDRFLERVFTTAERAYCLARVDWACALAGRFAAKEAVYKALSPASPQGMIFRDIEVEADGGRPRVVLTGEAAALAASREITTIHVTISHERHYAIAFAVASTE